HGSRFLRSASRKEGGATDFWNGACRRSRTNRASRSRPTRCFPSLGGAVVIAAPTMPAPFEPGHPEDQKQRDQLEKFVAQIGPRGVLFRYLPNNEVWRHTGLNPLIGSVMHRGDNGSRVRSKATDWLCQYRSVRAV